jgi:hypothetical protein
LTTDSSSPGFGPYLSEGCSRSLLVAVNKQHVPAFLGERRRNVDSQNGFANAALDVAVRIMCARLMCNAYAPRIQREG